MNNNITFDQIPLKKPSYKQIEKKLMGFIETLKSSKDANEALKVIRAMDKCNDKLQTQITIITIRYSLNTQDKKISKVQDQIDEMMPHISNLFNMWNKILVKLPYRKDLEKKLTPYYFQIIENSLKSFDEKIIPELIEINKLSSAYDKILGSAQIEFDGKTYNLSQMGKFSQSSDRKIRREATIKTDAWFSEHEKDIGDIYGKLVLLRDKCAKKLGYKNYIELGYLSLGRVDYNASMVKKYREQIEKEVVPVCQKLYKKQAKRLGIPFNKMFIYDFNLSFLSGNPKPIGSTKELVASATKMYDDMSKESGEFFHFMQDHHLLDLEARAGKQPGGYMTYLPIFKFPFIFSNFNGTEGDVNVLTHEVGHAFQGYLSSNIKPSDFRSPTLESCEIHSMSMEFFAWPYMNLFFGQDDEKYRFHHLADAIGFLPYGISIDEFQHWVYENPNVTHEERCNKWLEIEKKNQPHLKYDSKQKCFSHGARWIRQSHIFGMPFYYIDYTLAQVVAFQFLIEMRKNQPKAWKKYVKLCKCGGKYPFVELLNKNHLRNPFEDGSIKKVISPLKKVLNSMDDSKF